MSPDMSDDDRLSFIDTTFVPPDAPCWVSILACFLLACFYVGSLYVWRSDLPRDHPAVIKRRFTSVLIVSALSPVFVWAWKEFTGVEARPPLLALMGIRLEGIIPAVTLPLLLTMVLFLGPLIQLAADCPWGFLDGIKVGLAHFHHVIELLRFGQGTVSGIFLSAVFQFSYTAVFGAYTAFIFIRTGHLVGPVLCHSFCNYMGFPALSTALEHPQRLTVLASYLLGMLLFLLLLFPLTEPRFYGDPTPVCSLAAGSSSVCS
ncbi:CAAX prenyl protease 2 isoform X2 [Brienomyrus brachyistius]|uniref:CAAX prenyl protease 2 isoform X2 n=1 Tax=Brienomyrus brachyistius TaxID=42636 RepID=UPI0020B3DD7A|nr:CAAX prenyl protease 2 isoform X2 [Brienomyrus brachyistius]